jgi:hypothetical protein
MPTANIKTVVVRITSDNVKEVDVDMDIFDDPYMEAATRSVEIYRKSKHGTVRAIIECWDKVPPNAARHLYNSYWVLVNAACHEKAEHVREIFKAQTDCDLATEPMCAQVSKKA